MTDPVRIYNQEKLEYLLLELLSAIKENTAELRRARGNA